MSIIKPSEKSQEAMQAKTQAIPPKVREEVSPLPSGGTEGQVLTMGETEAEWDDIPSQLPEGGTEGQVLTMGASDPEWADVPTELPDGGTAGQVLTLEVPEGETDPVPAWKNAPTEDTYDIYLKFRNSLGTLATGEYTSATIESSVSGYYKNGSATLTAGFDAYYSVLFNKSIKVSKLIIDIPTAGSSSERYYGFITPYTSNSCGRVISSDGTKALDIRIHDSSINTPVVVALTTYTAHT